MAGMTRSGVLRQYANHWIQTQLVIAALTVGFLVQSHGSISVLPLFVAMQLGAIAGAVLKDKIVRAREGRARRGEQGHA
jgi:hypothetical protein